MGKKHTMTGGFHTETDCWCWKATDRQHIEKRVRAWFGEPVIAVEDEIERLLLSRALDEWKWISDNMPYDDFALLQARMRNRTAELIKQREQL